MPPRLLRSTNDRMIAGVCAGLGHYFGLDPVIVRLLFVVLAVTTGLALVLYPLLWFIMPQGVTGSVLPPAGGTDPPVHSVGDVALPGQGNPPAPAGAERRSTLALVLVGVGILILLDNLGKILGIDLDKIVVPLLLVGLGIYLLRAARA